MSQTSARLLSLLSLLQGSRDWTGTELAARLDVSARTVRSDIERLRALGYAVEANRGGVGGYRLGAGGASVPPLLLDADEAVAVGVGLRTGVNCIIGGMEETSVRALAKLEQLLPSALRHQVHTLNRFTVPLPENQPVPVVDPALLTRLAGLCRRRERLRFHYGDDDGGAEGDRRIEIEPWRLANRNHRWYLLGFDVGGDAWEVFEVHRIVPHEPNGPRFGPRRPPADDLADYLARRIPQVGWRHRATVTVHAPWEDVAPRVLASEGTVTPVDDRRCRATLGGETLTALTSILGRVGADFTVTGPPELVEHLQALAARYAGAVS
jgi:predicted DNA-binding transcriptional regulator YafY